MPFNWPLCLLVGCLTSQQQASVSQGRICTDKFECCHTEIEVAAQTFYLTQSQYTDTGPTSPSADPIMPGAWQGSHWSANFEVTGMTRTRKNPGASETGRTKKKKVVSIFRHKPDSIWPFMEEFRLVSTVLRTSHTPMCKTNEGRFVNVR